MHATSCLYKTTYIFIIYSYKILFNIISIYADTRSVVFIFCDYNFVFVYVSFGCPDKQFSACFLTARVFCVAIAKIIDCSI